jgi:vacuolar-type H+-ATPase subunit I/STV1
MTSLTNEEKAGVIDQHIKAVSYSLYNAQLDLIEAQAVSNSDTEVISGINARISDLNAKLSALDEELNSLT